MQDHANARTHCPACSGIECGRDAPEAIEATYAPSWTTTHPRPVKSARGRIHRIAKAAKTPSRSFSKRAAPAAPSWMKTRHAACRFEAKTVLKTRFRISAANVEGRRLFLSVDPVSCSQKKCPINFVRCLPLDDLTGREQASTTFSNYFLSAIAFTRTFKITACRDPPFHSGATHSAQPRTAHSLGINNLKSKGFLKWLPSEQ